MATNDLWAAARQPHEENGVMIYPITATRASAIICQQYGSPASVYTELRRGVEPPQFDPRLELKGGMAEEYFPIWAKKRFPFLKFLRATEFAPQTIPTGGVFVDPNCAWKRASVDWIGVYDAINDFWSLQDERDDLATNIRLDVLAGRAVLFEIKAPDARMRPQWYDNSNPMAPDGYEVQSRWEMAIVERATGNPINLCVLCPKFGEYAADYEYFPITRNDDLLTRIELKIEKYYETHLEHGIPPDWQNDPFADEMLGALNPIELPKVIKPMPPHIVKKTLEYLELNKQAKVITESKSDIATEFKAEIGSDFRLIGEPIDVVLDNSKIEPRCPQVSLSEPIMKKDMDAIFDALVNQITELRAELKKVLDGTSVGEETEALLAILPEPPAIVEANTHPGERRIDVRLVKPPKGK